MSFLERNEKNIQKVEKRIEKEEGKIISLQEKYQAKKITKAKFNIEKRKIEEKIKMMRARIQQLHGLGVKERKHIEEKAKKKEEKKEKKKKS